MRLFMFALIATPAITYLVYRLARGLGYLDPPASKEHEHRRTVTVALWAFLAFLPTFFYGYEKNWPRVWAIFGVVNGVALLFFAAMGAAAAVRLWRLRHPTQTPEGPAPDFGAAPPAEKPPVPAGNGPPSAGDEPLL